MNIEAVRQTAIQNGKDYIRDLIFNPKIKEDAIRWYERDVNINGAGVDETLGRIFSTQPFKKFLDLKQAAS
ncbi:MAG: hypothetical protein QNJ46_05900 [Leptolyngbyaceae cyanobacterium MO_188.B28]|nr:hypothetical protein [Leptolyngbyaceae cyanobacterium MO_188.B28]